MLFERGMIDHVQSQSVNGRFVCGGSLFCANQGLEDVETTTVSNQTGKRQGEFREFAQWEFVFKTFQVQVPEGDRTYLAHIATNMLSAVGGKFDEDDTIFADIYDIDGTDPGLYYRPKAGLPLPREDYGLGFQPLAMEDQLLGEGGVWGHHFAPVPLHAPGAEPRTQRISTWVGVIRRHITFRVAITGDNWVGASFFIMQL